jgi:exosortase
VEWSVNPQYHYGYAVPFLSLYLLWNAKHEPGGAGREARCGRREAQDTKRKAAAVAALLLALAWLPTRLIEEANPEWRLVSWALALEVIGLTIYVAQHSPLYPLLSSLSSPRSRRSTLNVPSALRSPTWFPAAFFLVAVPWPTFLEFPFIQGLTRANASITVEILGLLGIPALQHGNIIEVGAGAVGIDDACSGIRSLQATLMLSLFFGEVFRLAVARRFGLCAAGFALAFIFNVARTTLLTGIAASKGLEAMNAWHDAAGTGILLACFLSLWLLARWLRPRTSVAQPAPAQRIESPALPFGPPLEATVSYFPLLLIPAWIAFSEIATECWYRIHERQLPPPITWSVFLPIENANYKPQPFSERVNRFLRYDEGLRGGWQADDDTRWQAIFLRWNPGRTAVNLASSHTPEACVTASGRELLDKSDIRFETVDGLRLPFRFYTFRDNSGPLHVAYCLWQDRGNEAMPDETSAGYANRLAHVLAGRRNCGQRSLELAVWGIDDSAAAMSALERQIGELVKRQR